MKKVYIQPVVGIKDVLSECLLLNTSELITTNSDYGIAYGGVDTEGEKTPDSREIVHHSVWDD